MPVACSSGAGELSLAGWCPALPDRSAIDPIIDEPLVQSREHVIHGTTRRELDDKESNEKYGEEPRGNRKKLPDQICARHGASDLSVLGN